MSTADIGLIGLAVMGSNLALNIAEKGYTVAVHNRSPGRIDEFVAEAKEQGLDGKTIPKYDLADFVQTVKAPRSIIIMVKAGKPVDDMIEQLLPHLEPGDAIIECGNSLFTDTQRRFDYLKPKNIGYLGVGVSGGEEGARHGPSIMVGGSKEQWHNAEAVLTAIAAKFNGESCCAYLGEGGAGHFVKTIHNGIEYGDMQMIAEVYGVMRDGLGMTAKECAAVFKKWNEGPLNSYLIEITGHVLDAVDAESGKPLVDLILDKAGQKGTGVWSAIAAQQMGVPATAIEGAVAARSISSRKDERVAAEAIYGKPNRAKTDVTLEDLEKALLAGKIVSYAQGFAVIAKASEENGWALPLATIAKIWRAGCIIRSRFLDQMSSAYAKGEATNLLVVPDFVTIMKDSHPSLRKVVAAAAVGEFPMICLSAALSYFDSYRQAQGTANLIQGQRDFFGAHGFEIVGRGTDLHGTWPSTLGK
ncbi:NADP-dependent phosphogluconate dehydrogenase [Devosia sp. 63-57]|uniref:NADP-dependent phosphogluconate dehydrogenase n=1 Tax=Devosia sp. 63-57 TaxID=1895751 RepID=UPI00086A7DB8|nr:NADP-dependent phosphogluconate dehydrogenase [Devosia sp. 63-57]ODT49840.1 MAG: phosphogluconate dehydrogenase (NADP(+)-dependent, decarboxylating) [Pelagibacterium sp. SCN 63-126]ODU86273.1 MAG: phosphogluconate dehydrogenase (NADP(+)-dependent, decarboxylating) [Pelagibacterium sp. SCN 63-17]OJX45215.1 MAG: phosphogluconate dehydrogenase (NADP(+)-dependent, decarboxylating) [Devosia sp. 63-57]